MSTPTSTLNGNTKKTDNNDINDPIVQDVLNEFRDEYSYKNKNTNSSMIPDYEDEVIEYPPDDNYPPHPPQNRRPEYNVYDRYPPSQYHKNNSITNIDMELVKKNLMIVIIVLLIHNTSLISTFYDKMPEYLHENLNSYDILIKALSLFIILYVLSLFNYI
tara:strand:+ start:636 stop:1118 length:483 start_codon:yes stop_codon:yes gene_type:complete